MLLDTSGGGSSLSVRPDGLSYKFQRLRERLRQAIASGELVGRLPGERVLARRFHVNAKTLSKALTDLAAEGLLDRNIGRGTYVKDAAAPQKASTGPWLIVCDPGRANTTLASLLLQANPRSVLVHDVAPLRPSFLRQFDTIVDLGNQTPESFLRDMVVRNIRVVALNREPGIFSVNLVSTDRALGASSLARDLLLAGHRRLAVVESLPHSNAARLVQQTAQQYASDALIEVCGQNQVVEVARHGATAFICDSTFSGNATREALEAAGVRVPGDVSVGGLGCDDDSNANSGYFVDCELLVRNVVDLVHGGCNGHPVTLWLTPTFRDRGTMRPLKSAQLA